MSICLSVDLWICGSVDRIGSLLPKVENAGKVSEQKLPRRRRHYTIGHMSSTIWQRADTMFCPEAVQ